MGHPGSPGRVSLSGEHAFVGRQQELELLRSGFDRAADGNGGLYLISGEAGIGKTSLVQALILEARQSGALPLSGAAFDLSSTPPHGPWLELAGRYQPSEADPKLPELLDRNAISHSGRSQDERFHEALSFFINLAERHPVVLALEDLHWSDENSLDLLRFIARHVARHRILIIATYRDDELNREHPLYFRIPVLVRESLAVRLELSPLERSEISQLVHTCCELPQESHDRLVAYLLQMTDGNPLFTVELTRTLEREGVLHLLDGAWKLAQFPDEAVPSLIRQMVDQRMESLSEPARRTIQRAAVFGAEVPIHIWEQLSPDDLSIPIAEEILGTSLMIESPRANALSFRHALVREAIHASLPLFSRREFHREIAELHMNESPLDPDDVAYHLRQAADPRAWEWLIRAGLRARDAAAWLISAERFKEAARLVEKSPEYETARGWLLFYAAYLLRYSSDPRNFEFLDESLRVADATDDTLLRGFNYYHRGSVRCMRGDVRRGLEELERGVQELEQLAATRQIPGTEAGTREIIEGLLEHPEAVSEPFIDASQPAREQSMIFQHGVLVNWLAQSGQYVRASEMGEQFLQPGDGASLDGSVHPSWFLGLAHSAAALGQVKQAIDQYSFAIDRFREIGDYHMIEYGSWANLWMLAIPYQTEDLSERRRLVDQGDGAARRSSFIDGDEFLWCGTLDNFLKGNLDFVHEASRQELETTLSIIRGESAMINISEIHLLRREYDQIWPYLAEILPEGPDTSPGNNCFATAIQVHRIAAQTALRTRDHENARRWLECRDNWLRWSGAVLWNSEQHLLWAEYFRATGEIEQANAATRRATQAAGEPRQPRSLLQAHRMAARLALDVGDLDLAECQLADAVALADQCGIAYELATTRLLQAELQVEKANLDEAQRLLDCSDSLLTQLGAQPALDHIEQLRSRSSIPTKGTSQTLSKRELEVLSLLTDGKSDREIAGELYISHHTVMRHVSSILRKLDVTSRTSAAAMAVRDDLV